jgi:hypothetical protein
MVVLCQSVKTRRQFRVEVRQSLYAAWHRKWGRTIAKRPAAHPNRTILCCLPLTRTTKKDSTEADKQRPIKVVFADEANLLQIAVWIARDNPVRVDELEISVPGCRARSGDTRT